MFHKVHGFKGGFDIVKVANEMPHRYGKNGELLISYEETAEAREVAERRRSSVARESIGAEKDPFGNSGATEKREEL